MCRPAWAAHHEDARQAHPFRQKGVIQRRHNLLSIQPELHGNGFDSVDRGAVHIGLAGFPQASIANRQAEACEQTGKCGRTAIHVGSLYHLGHQQAGFATALGSCHGLTSYPSAAMAF
jgi:hypothetical protein